MVRIGTAGWNIPSPHRDRFPAGGSHLERYARLLNCSEINSSFHRPHQDKTWQRWADSVPETFRFSVKAPRTVTHDCALRPSQGVLQEFFRQANLLETKLGPVLFQLPPSQEFDEEVVRALFGQIRALHGGAVVLEPRHASWFTTEADALLRHFHIPRVAADPARHSRAAEPGGDGSLAYYRLHGSPRMYYSSYAEDFLRSLARETRSAKRETWFLFDNTAHGHAIGNALRLMELLGTHQP